MRAAFFLEERVRRCCYQAGQHIKKKRPLHTMQDDGAVIGVDGEDEAAPDPAPPADQLGPEAYRAHWLVRLHDRIAGSYVVMQLRKLPLEQWLTRALRRISPLQHLSERSLETGTMHSRAFEYIEEAYMRWRYRALAVVCACVIALVLFQTARGALFYYSATRNEIDAAERVGFMVLRGDLPSEAAAVRAPRALFCALYGRRALDQCRYAQAAAAACDDDDEWRGGGGAAWRLRNRVACDAHGDCVPAALMLATALSAPGGCACLGGRWAAFASADGAHLEMFVNYSIVERHDDAGGVRWARVASEARVDIDVPPAGAVHVDIAGDASDATPQPSGRLFDASAYLAYLPEGVRGLLAQRVYGEASVRAQPAPLWTLGERASACVVACDARQ